MVHKDRTNKDVRKGVFGANAGRFTNDLGASDVFITSYEGTKSMVKDNEDEASQSTQEKMILDYFGQYFDNRLCIVDECHKAKNPCAQRSKSTVAVMLACKCSLAMTGTPILNRPEEIVHIIKGLRRFDEIAVDDADFNQKYVEEARYGDLCTKLHNSGWFVRRLKEDVLKELPAKSRGEMTIQMTPAEQFAYAAARRGLTKKGITTANKLAILVNLQTVANDAKVRPVAEWIMERCDHGLPTVIQSTRKDPLHQIHKLLEAEGIACAVMDGATSKPDRQRIQDSFQKGGKKDYQVVLTTLAEGITLTRADTMAILDFDWSHAYIAQREDRIHRIGQKNVVKIFRCIAASIDLHKKEVVADKQSMAANCLDHGRNAETVVHFQFEVIRRLEKEAREADGLVD
jgi:SWI/SNF-related matrix-associated actin-dependent regulator 1 of chromatin subfamily A